MTANAPAENAKHTPGPWGSCTAGSRMSEEYLQPFAVHADIGTLVCGCFGDTKGGREAAEANARLIAAAPNMYEALKNLMLHYERLSDDAIIKAFGMAIYLRVRDARAAIAKAEGSHGK